MHREYIKGFSDENEKRIQEINSILETLPDRKLICARNGNSPKYYERVGKKLAFIPAENRGYAFQLGMRRLLLTELDDLEKEQKLFATYLKKSASLGKKYAACQDPTSPMRKLLGNSILTNNEKIQEWINADYVPNPYKSDELIHQTTAGFPVRSKSEAMIVSELVHKGIAFRYECPLSIGNKVYYPDFTLLHPVTLKVWYWEHLGLMDSPSYAMHATQKLADYASIDILPYVNLLITSETGKYPLTQFTIEHTIQFFLDYAI